ncbi:MAG: Crp/Fnr family transcriptional regulator [Cytophagales bacterium]|nr:MAG: Crp/Fnr family transcriptional regulator [Cytophagales bacterium]
MTTYSLAKWLQPFMISQRFEALEYIYQEGNAFEGLFLLQKGFACVLKNNKKSNILIDFVHEGSVLGIDGVQQNRYLHSVKALSTIEVGFVKKNIIEDIRKQEANFNLFLIQALCEQVGRANQKSVVEKHKSLKTDLAQVLRAMIIDYKITNNTPIQFVMPIEEIANRLLTSSEVVVRILEDFQRDGVLQLLGNNVKKINNTDFFTSRF